MSQTVYTIRNNGITYQTTDSEEVNELKEQGAAVKATHYVDLVQQTENDEGTLIMNADPNWLTTTGKHVQAEPSGWVYAEDMR